MLKYCAWCGSYQGPAEGEGYQIRRDVCEIDTATICPPCHDKVVEAHYQQHPDSNRI
ncbi:MAG TPA: hypothetical protein VJ995_09515 [Geothermobacteraceae bacterium]|nr:hypothetical protein [Geothermobacteraceae bacterium]